MPRDQLLSPEAIERLVRRAARRGVRKIRLTGGEPLTRRDVIEIVRRIRSCDIERIALSTNGALLPLYADQLYRLGVRDVNISLDSLKPDVFRRITRGGDITKTLRGIEAARQAGMKVKINVVALAGINESEIPNMILWAHAHDMALSLIETMPMSDTGFDLTKHYLPLVSLRDQLAQHWQLVPEAVPDKDGGPASYVRIAETGGRLGFIAPLTNNFCASCNRMRITANGRLYMCLGQSDSIDLAPALRCAR